MKIANVISKLLTKKTFFKRGETASLPTKYGNFRIIPFIQLSDKSEYIALIKGNWTKDEIVMIRLHSSCATGDLFGSYRCDCGDQLHESMRMIESEGKGVIIYLDQEGRGIGLLSKIQAYKLQDDGLDTVDANIELGFKPDERNYIMAYHILKELGINKLKLITNNIEKTKALENFGFQVIENIPIEITPNKFNRFYLETKKTKMGHSLTLQ